MDNHLINYNNEQLKNTKKRINDLKDENRKLIEYMYSLRSTSKVVKFCVEKMNTNLNTIKSMKYESKQITKQNNYIEYEGDLKDIE